MSTISSMEAELLLGVLSTTAHDLGGLASALALRADVLERVGNAEASAPLRRIADELRILGRDVRAFGGSEGGDSLSPITSGSLQSWLARTIRFGKSILPRGSSLEGHTPDAMVESAHAGILTYLALATLQQITTAAEMQRVAVRVDAAVEGSNARIAFRATVNDAPLQLPGSGPTAWWQWAVERADESPLVLGVAQESVNILVPLFPQV